MTKTYTQKQYDNAKERAYNKGFKACSESVTVEEALDSAKEIKEYKKWEQINFDLSLWLLVLVCLGVILSMIF